VPRVTFGDEPMKTSTPAPFVSVVVCAYNSERLIARAIEALLAQDYPHERYEIVVVDDGSCDRTQEIIRNYPVTIVRHETNLGRGAARNSGLAWIKGSIYVCFDDDCVVDPNWLSQLVEGYQQPDVAGVGSSIKEPTELRGLASRFTAAAGSFNPPSLRLGASKHPVHRFASYFMDQLFPEMPTSTVYRVRELNGATASFPVDVLRSVGGWDTSLRAVEDADLRSRIARKYPGSHFYTVSTALVIHDPEMSLRNFVYRPYARGLDTLRYYRSNRIIPPIFPFPILWLAASVLSALVNPLLGILVALVLPQLLYLWWPIRAVRDAKLWHLLFTYLQLAEESATVVGLIRGQLLLRVKAGSARRL